MLEGITWKATTAAATTSAISSDTSTSTSTKYVSTEDPQESLCIAYVAGQKALLNKAIGALEEYRELVRRGGKEEC
jgi:hypothetical protein